ncbi:MAG: threonine ammonia-lyase [Polyangiaceae bacterium]|nr:threonine ammonia-lyase [Polyangiaceae bacterium]
MFEQARLEQSVTLKSIEEARARIRDRVLLTPVSRSEKLSQRTGKNVWLKFENQQRTGSFKERGACNRLLLLSPEERSRGVVCASAGNHAQGVAYHATKLGIDSTIVMPEMTPLNKVERTKGYGGRVVLYGASVEDSLAEARRIEQTESRTFVHPFDDDAVISGQGTIGLEFLERVPSLDTLLIAIGGGGLASGIGIAARALNPKIRLIGVETKALPSMKVAIQERAIVTLPPARTLAEGIAVRRAGKKTFAILRELLDDLLLVDDEEIAEAILFLLEEEKTVVEGAGAAAIAALLRSPLPRETSNVGIVLCGGNIDVHLMSRILERGLVKSGRTVRIVVRLPDIAGSLATLADTVAKASANVLDIRHDRAFGQAGLSEVTVELVLETKGFDHIEELHHKLRERGYLIVE